LSGNDGGPEKIFEISSLATNCRAEGVSRVMNWQLLSMAGEAWRRRVSILRTIDTPVVDTIGAWYRWQRLVVPAAGPQKH